MRNLKLNSLFFLPSSIIFFNSFLSHTEKNNKNNNINNNNNNNTSLSLSTQINLTNNKENNKENKKKENERNVIIQKYNQITIIYKDKQQFERKLNKFIQEGKNKLQIIADFDFTLTKFLNDSRQRSFSCHAVIEENQYVAEEYRKLSIGLFHYYYPIETSSTLSIEEKIPHMVEWVNKAHDLMVERSGLTQSMIKLIVSEALQAKKISLRNGVTNYLNTLISNEIPILIFSAGLGDVIEEIFHQNNIRVDSNSSLYVVSNHMKFTNDRLTGFTSPSYHVFNKTASSALHNSFFQHHDLEHRKNLILLGDSLGDVTMSDGLNILEDSTIKIGFLNDKAERILDYLEVYDVVILGDPDFRVPTDILDKILT